jgi:hypothetical protein
MGLFRELFGFDLFGDPPPPLPMSRGIVGVTEDGCYLVQREDGTVVKSHPIEPSSPAKSRDEPE